MSEEKKVWNSAGQVALLELMDRAGFKKAREVAEFTKVSESRISRYLSGERSIDPLFINSFRAALEKREGGGTRYPEQKEKVAGMDPPEVEQAADQLREMHRTDPAAFKAAAGVLEQLSSKANYARRTLVKNAASREKNDSPKPPPKPKAGERSAGKS